MGMCVGERRERQEEPKTAEREGEHSTEWSCAYGSGENSGPCPLPVTLHHDTLARKICYTLVSLYQSGVVVVVVVDVLQCILGM